MIESSRYTSLPLPLDNGYRMYRFNHHIRAANGRHSNPLREPDHGGEYPGLFQSHERHVIRGQESQGSGLTDSEKDTIRRIDSANGVSDGRAAELRFRSCARGYFFIQFKAIPV